MEIRDFTSDEIGELNSYITTQIPHTVLPRLFILTEEPLKKALAYITIFRTLTGVRDFSESDDTKKKIDDYLNPHIESYDEIYRLHIYYDNAESAISKHYKKEELIEAIIKYNMLVNKLINDFLVFAEKQELLSTDEVSGLNLEKPEGEEVYKKILANAKID